MNEKKGEPKGDAKSVIVKEILIDAPAAKVWRHLTDPIRIAGWLMPNDFALRVGHAFVMQCREGGKDACVVKEIVPEKKLVYSWQSEQTRVETTVTITLTAEGKGTRVRLVHSGWDQLPPAERGVIDGHDRGWTEVLAKLRAQVEGVTGAAR